MVAVISPSDCFGYSLPVDRIAQRPAYPYDAAKMLVMSRGATSCEDRTFSGFPELVRARDLVIFNNSRVIPARLFGLISGRQSHVELLLLRPFPDDTWTALARPLKKLKAGDRINVTERLVVEVLEKNEKAEVVVRLISTDGVPVHDVLLDVGTMPVPPYIREGRGDDQDVADYQPLLAKVEGSIAAPTASLHFTSSVMDGIRARGAEIAEVTLHVGAASFLPLWRPGQDTEITPPSSERCEYSTALVQKIDAVKMRGGRVIAVGTTVARALETFMRTAAADRAILETELFITPGFEWRAVDVLVTNFHQPHTTHLLLVESFMGREALESAYAHALDADYRFLSYGDGMVVLP